MLGTMRINLTRDIDVFLPSAGRWLTKDPVGNNVLLTTIAAQHAGHVKGAESALYGWAEERGEIRGALTAIVAAVCKHLLGQGYSCISITNRGNPHAGATLRAIGFEPATSLTDFQFGARQ